MTPFDQFHDEVLAAIRENTPAHFRDVAIYLIEQARTPETFDQKLLDTAIEEMTPTEAHFAHGFWLGQLVGGVNVLRRQHERGGT